MTTISVLLTRYGFLLVGLMEISYSPRSGIDFQKEAFWALRVGTVTEVVLAVYLLLNGDTSSRLTINHHAVGGAISIGMFPLLAGIYFYQRDLWNKLRLKRYLFIHLVIVTLSGTRGYMVMAALSLLPLLMDYFRHGGTHNRRLKAAVILCAGTAALFAVNIDDAMQYISSVFRLKESIGYRVNENTFIKSIMPAAPWYNQLFGFGLGGRADRVPGYSAIVRDAAGARTWMVKKLKTEKTVHNYWYTILFKQGISGLFACGSIFVTFWNKILPVRRKGRMLFWTLILFFLGILISLTYRISATCGVFELFILLWITQQFKNWSASRREPSGRC